MTERLLPAFAVAYLAAPKSSSFILPSLVMKILSGEMSLWMIPSLCTSVSVSRTGSMMLSVSSYDSLPLPLR